MSKAKIVFMGTPDFAVKSLEALYKNDYDIKLVVTQQDKRRGRGKKLQYTAVKEKALDLDLKVSQPEDINSEEMVKTLKDISPDFIVVAAFGQILKEEILEIAKYKCINVHASLLPKYRGAAPINWAIINGEKETGITIMEMERGLDTGDMISKKSIPIDIEDDYISIHDELALIGGKLLVETLEDIKLGKATMTSQDDSLSSYAPMIYKATGKIDWNRSGIDILNLIKGVIPWPGAFTSYKDETLKIYKAEVLERFNKEESGKIVKVSNQGVFVNCEDSTLLIKELQFPNKKRMEVKEYLKGNTIEVGVILK